VQWGLYVDNDQSAAGGSLWGSTTQITNTTIVTHPPGSDLMNPDNAFRFFGDGGADILNFIGATLGGIFQGTLYHGNNGISTLDSLMAGIDVVSGFGNDTITFDDTRFISYVYLFLDDGADRLNIHNTNYATQWPNPLLAIVEIDADFGVDTFSGVVPPNDIFAGFDIFLP
jgi:hypothetical protein